MLTNTDQRLAEPRRSALAPFRLSFLIFFAGGFFLKLYGRKRGSVGLLLRKKRSVNTVVSRTLYYFRSSVTKGVHPRHPPRTFPLGLLAPRCLGLARFLALRHCGAGARAPAVWGKEGILPPASPRLGRARPTGSHNPHPRFHTRVSLKIIYFFLLITSALIL